MNHHHISIDTQGRGCINVTDHVQKAIPVGCNGIAHVFIQHTSASLIIMENADPDVLTDLERYFTDLVLDGDPRFKHSAEGPDDMSAHVRSALTQTSLSVPVADGRLLLGTWQGLYLWEHRYRPHTRHLVVSVLEGD